MRRYIEYVCVYVRHTREISVSVSPSAVSRFFFSSFVYGWDYYFVAGGFPKLEDFRGKYIKMKRREN